MTFNRKLLQLEIAKKGFTQQQLADKIGISRTGLNGILTRGTCHPSNLVKIANALDIEPVKLLNNEERG